MTRAKACAWAALLRSIHSCNKLNRLESSFTSWAEMFLLIQLCIQAAFVILLPCRRLTFLHPTGPFSHNHQIHKAFHVLEAKNVSGDAERSTLLNSSCWFQGRWDERQEWNVASQTIQRQEWPTTLKPSFETLAFPAKYSRSRNSQWLPPFPKSNHCFIGRLTYMLLSHNAVGNSFTEEIQSSRVMPSSPQHHSVCSIDKEN